MRLARFGHSGSERPAISGTDGQWRDLTSVTADITPAFLTELKNLDLSTLPVLEQPGRFGPPLTGVGKIICVGLNYVDHARETGAAAPPEPILFMKALTPW